MPGKIDPDFSLNQQRQREKAKTNNIKIEPKCIAANITEVTIADTGTLNFCLNPLYINPLNVSSSTIGAHRPATEISYNNPSELPLSVPESPKYDAIMTQIYSRIRNNKAIEIAYNKYFGLNLFNPILTFHFISFIGLIILGKISMSIDTIKVEIIAAAILPSVDEISIPSPTK